MVLIQSWKQFYFDVDNYNFPDPEFNIDHQNQARRRVSIISFLGVIFLISETSYVY